MSENLFHEFTIVPPSLMSLRLVSNEGLLKRVGHHIEIVEFLRERSGTCSQSYHFKRDRGPDKQQTIIMTELDERRLRFMGSLSDCGLFRS